LRQTPRHRNVCPEQRKPRPKRQKKSSELDSDAITNEKFKARRPVLKDLADQFKAEAAHLRKKASTGKITKALAAEMKRDINDNFDHAIAKKKE
jgi:hypothetical protein